MTEQQMRIFKTTMLQFGEENVSCELLDNGYVLIKTHLPNGIIHREFISGYNCTIKTNNIIPNEYVIVYRTPENIEKTIISNNLENDIHLLLITNCKPVTVNMVKSGNDSISPSTTETIEVQQGGGRY